MTTFNFKKSMSRMALLGSAAFLLNMGSAVAADHDAQVSARELLSGTAAGVSLPRTTGIAQSALDAQEQARRLMTGTPSPTSAPTYAVLSSRTSGAANAARGGVRHAYPDAQALAERVITGKAG